MKDKTPILKVMISSSVYGAQSLLRQIYATLLGFGYDVICSPVGTLTVNPTQSNLENCLRAVEECDIFVGFIRPIYGSGRDSKKDKSISHLELERAIALNRPRWMLAHSSVVKMRSLVRHLFYKRDGSRKDREFKPLKGEFDDVRVIEMYDLAADSLSKKPWSQRTNHWVHEYHYDFEALDFVQTQFRDPQRVAEYLAPRKA
ncbi:MAG TPA: hypothetical protein DCZ97_09615 [Syntrophus sp. (in: bacteria)]|nr:hypothetical protein [Syntrophus sp. (in: bacteria)]